MNKFRIVSVFLILAMLFGFAGVNPAAAVAPVSFSVIDFPVGATGSYSGLAVDSQDNLFAMSECGNKIYKTPPGGSASLYMTLAGTSCPWQLAFDTADNLFVIDSIGGNSRNILKVTPAGVVSTYVTGATLAAAGANSYNPGLAIDSTGNLYVSTWNNNKIFKVSPAGVVSLFAYVPGAWNLAFDSAGNLFAASSSLLYKVTPAGVVSQFAAIPNGRGGSLAIDRADTIYVAGTCCVGNSYVYKVTPAGVVSTFISPAIIIATGEPSIPAVLASLGSFYPIGLTVDSSGNVYMGHYQGTQTVLKATIYPSLPPVNTNEPPTTDAGGPYNGSEGSAITLSGASASDPDVADTLTYAWTVDSALCSFDDASLLNPDLTCSDNGSFSATLSVDDGVNPSVSSDADVQVNNVAPLLGAISVSAALVEVNTSVSASASFTDPGLLDTHTAAWDWGDGSSTGTVTQAAGSGSVLDSHSYSTPGVYTIKLIVSDNNLAASSEVVYQFVVVYDPSGGFVTGGGWINSPAGAYKADPSLAGKANFGFVAKYKKGANVPDGNTQFQFKAGDLNFHSSSYEWLVVAGNKAQFRGFGTINGQGSYMFMITADDDSPDTFRIHIWGDSGTIYDNGSQQSLGGGSIVIHK
jgi:sugar lactone lactonase YvrE